MLTYELANRLKDAGFPQIRIKGGEARHPTNPDMDCYSPTLEELIDECGDDFLHLTHAFPGTDTPWTADSYRLDEDMPYGYQRPAATPEIAVANLWLLLNEK